MTGLLLLTALVAPSRGVQSFSPAQGPDETLFHQRVRTYSRNVTPIAVQVPVHDEGYILAWTRYTLLVYAPRTLYRRPASAVP